MDEQATKIKAEKVFKVCPNCGYKNGFHAMFERVDESGVFSWKLICPQCEKVFDIGLTVHLDKPSAKP